MARTGQQRLLIRAALLVVALRVPIHKVEEGVRSPRGDVAFALLRLRRPERVPRGVVAAVAEDAAASADGDETAPMAAMGDSSSFESRGRLLPIPAVRTGAGAGSGFAAATGTGVVDAFVAAAAAATAGLPPATGAAAAGAAAFGFEGAPKLKKSSGDISFFTLAAGALALATGTSPPAVGAFPAGCSSSSALRFARSVPLDEAAEPASAVAGLGAAGFFEKNLVMSMPVTRTRSCKCANNRPPRRLGARWRAEAGAGGRRRAEIARLFAVPLESSSRGLKETNGRPCLPWCNDV